MLYTGLKPYRSIEAPHLELLPPLCAQACRAQCKGLSAVLYPGNLRGIQTVIHAIPAPKLHNNAYSTCLR